MNKVFILIKWVGTGYDRHYWIQDVFNTLELAQSVADQRNLNQTDFYYEVYGYIVKDKDVIN